MRICVVFFFCFLDSVAIASETDPRPNSTEKLKHWRRVKFAEYDPPAIATQQSPPSALGNREEHENDGGVRGLGCRYGECTHDGRVVSFEALSTGTFFKIVYDNGFTEWRPAEHLQEWLPEEDVYILPGEHARDSQEGGRGGGRRDSQDAGGLRAAAWFDLKGEEMDNNFSMHSEKMAMLSRLLAWHQHVFTQTGVRVKDDHQVAGEKKELVSSGVDSEVEKLREQVRSKDREIARLRRQLADETPAPLDHLWWVTIEVTNNVQDFSGDGIEYGDASLLHSVALVQLILSSGSANGSRVPNVIIRSTGAWDVCQKGEFDISKSVAWFKSLTETYSSVYTKLLINQTDYIESIKIALSLSGEFRKSVIFHCYWNGILNEKHLYSILSCYYFNVYNNKHKRTIILWLENNTPNHYNTEIEKYAEIRYFSSSDERKKTNFMKEYNHNFSPEIDMEYDDITFYSDFVRALLLYNYGGVWFDLDCFILRSFDPLFYHFENEICLYQWQNLNYPNNAIYISLEPKSEKMKKNIEYIMNVGRGWGFQEAKLTYDSQLDILVLPCSWFDADWIPNPHNIGTTKFFAYTDIQYDYSNFFKGSFCYHWHNQWSKRIGDNSIIIQLVEIIRSNL